MDQKDKFKNTYPHTIFLEHEISHELENFLKRKKWITAEEQVISTEKPGEGNMNFVLRVITDKKSFILKQSRPWVQKYPQVEAPIGRISVEYHFYHYIAPYKEVNKYTPAVIGFDAAQFMLALEDLGSGADYTYLYQKNKQLSKEEIKALSGLISVLHQVTVDFEDRVHFDNQPMKVLNHEHIFVFPYALENGFDLDTIQAGLQALAMRYKKNESLKKKISKLGEVYLENYDTLLHGDYYPGSWLKVESGLKLIDPEFSYFGKAEFDLGVMLAHLKMAQQPEGSTEQVLKFYEQPEGFDEALMWAFVGVEMMRRIIGLAQLPLSLELSEKEDLLEEAVSLINLYNH
ncbi:5-methylthioribose kinase [Catalinimonas alkaloidigena]|uniref:phosphotransferase n=1 Tax=Catalinimonas alkaloidigena TaxID=1075417 RepID=UPI0024075143|nr:phosphotransferase [Catalinimonas alkaloidigena]MDF9801193.1 5-methylthioribose kinase [Catalinimonas alkaloidigena]